MKNDAFSYLRKSGAIATHKKAIAVSGSARGKGALGSASVETKGLAKRANIEGNESKMYEKLEKRSLRSLKEGGSEKELRRGHNFGGLVDLIGGGGGSSSKPRRKHPKGDFDFAKNPIAATRQASKARRQEARASGVKGAVKNARLVNRRNLTAAKETRAMRDDQGLGKADRAAYKTAQKPKLSAGKPKPLGAGGARAPMAEMDTKFKRRPSAKSVARRTGLGSMI